MVQTRRVLIVDDHPVFLRGLRAMLETEPWVEEVVEAMTVADAVKEAVSRQVHVVAMDVTLPDGDGIEATRRILQARPEVHLLMLTMSAEQDIVAKALRAGAHGYVLKDTDPDTVLDMLRTVAAGGFVMGPKVNPKLVNGSPGASADYPPPFDRLTERERDILTRLACGDTNAQIARRLGLADKTVRNQLTEIYQKLGVTDRTRAALLAREAGIVG